VIPFPLGPAGPPRVAYLCSSLNPNARPAAATSARSAGRLRAPALLHVARPSPLPFELSLPRREDPRSRRAASSVLSPLQQAPMRGLQLAARGRPSSPLQPARAMASARSPLGPARGASPCRSHGCAPPPPRRAPQARPGGSWARPSRPCPCTPPVQCPLAEQPQPRSWSALLRPILLFLVLGGFSHGRRGHLHCIARLVAPHAWIPHRRRDARAHPSPDRRRPLSRGPAQRRGRRRRVLGPLAVGPSHLVRPAQRRRPRRQQRR
jgi:hypothetical protein